MSTWVMDLFVVAFLALFLLHKLCSFSQHHVYEEVLLGNRVTLCLKLIVCLQSLLSAWNKLSDIGVCLE